jgi:hypothetical protein
MLQDVNSLLETFMMHACPTWGEAPLFSAYVYNEDVSDQIDGATLLSPYDASSDSAIEPQYAAERPTIMAAYGTWEDVRMDK